jgi:hypothetical protein
MERLMANPIPLRAHGNQESRGLTCQQREHFLNQFR